MVDLLTDNNCVCRWTSFSFNIKLFHREGKEFDRFIHIRFSISNHSNKSKCLSRDWSDRFTAGASLHRIPDFAESQILSDETLGFLLDDSRLCDNHYRYHVLEGTWWFFFMRIVLVEQHISGAMMMMGLIPLMGGLLIISKTLEMGQKRGRSSIWLSRAQSFTS